MNRKALRILVIALTVVFCTILIGSTCFAAEDPSAFNELADQDKFDDIGGRILGLLRALGIIISVGVLMVLGIKYMMGSAEEKAEYKKTMIPYVVGAILLFAASVIATAIATFVTELQ